MFSLKKIFPPKKFLFIQIPLIILLFVFIGSFYFSQYHQIEENYNNKAQDDAVVDFQILEESLYNSHITSASFLTEVDNLDNSIQKSDVLFIQQTMGLKFYLTNDLLSENSTISKFKFVFSDKIDKICPNQSLNTGLNLIEGRYPSDQGEIIVGVGLKSKGICLNDEINYTLFHRDYETEGKNFTFQVVGFYQISEIEFLKSILSYHFNIAQEGNFNATNVISGYSVQINYIFGHRSLGLSLYNEYQNRELNEPSNMYWDIPIFSKICIINFNHTHKNFKEITDEISIINNWIKQINPVYSLKFIDMESLYFKYSSTSHEKYALEYYIEEINLYSSSNPYGFLASSYHIIESLSHLELDLFFFSIPFIIILALTMNYSFEKIIDENIEKISNLYSFGKDLKIFERNFVKSFCLKLSLIFLLVLLIFTGGISLIPNIGILIIKNTILGIIFILILISLTTTYILRKNLHKKIVDYIDLEYYEFQEDFELSEWINKKNQRKKRRRFIFGIIYSIIPLILIKIFDTRLYTEYSILDQFYSVIIFGIVILLIPEVIILPILFSYLMEPIISFIHVKIFDKLSFKKQKNLEKHLYLKIMKENSTFSNKSIILFTLIFSILFSSTAFYTFQQDKNQYDQLLEWDEANLKIKYSSFYENSTEYFEKTQKLDNFLLNSEGFESKIKIYDTFLDVKPSKYNTQYTGIWAKILDNFTYANFIDTENIQVEDMIEGAKTVYDLFQILFSSPNSVIISSTLAHSENILVNDNISISIGYFEYAKNYNTKVIGIINSAPLLDINSDTHAIFGLDSNIEENIWNTEIYVKTNSNFSITNFYQNFLNNMTLTEGLDIEELSYIDSIQENKPLFLEKLLLYENLVIILCLFYLFIMNFNDFEEKRKKDTEKLFYMGLDKFKTEKLIKKEFIIFWSIIVIFSFLISLLIMNYIYDILFLLYRFGYDMSDYVGFMKLRELILVVSSTSLYFKGKTFFVPFRINIIIFTLPVFLMFEFYLFNLIKGRIKKNDKSTFTTSRIH